MARTNAQVKYQERVKQAKQKGVPYLADATADLAKKLARESLAMAEDNSAEIKAIEQRLNRLMSDLGVRV